MGAESGEIGLSQEWAESRIVDFDAIEHCRTIGEVTVWGDQLKVEILRRDDLDLSTRPATVTCSPMKVSLEGRRMAPAVARALAALLLDAADAIESAA